MNKKYDIKLYRKTKKPLYLEVKTDRLINKTGNICIEYEYNNNPSGINSTKSKYFLIVEIINDNKYNMYKIPTLKIKEAINDNTITKKTICGGDGYKSKLYLFKKEIFLKYLKVINYDINKKKT